MYYIYETLKVGDSSIQVTQLQRSLPVWASSQPVVADGVFGSATQEAVKNFQQASKLDADGIVGKVTASALGVWAQVENGFDISHWNTIYWDKVPADIKFVEIKATEGVTYVDPAFYDNAQNARDLGLHVGAYHFTKFNNPPLKEAANFLECAHKAGVDSVTLDLEYRTSSLTSEKIQAWVLLFMRSCEAFYDVSNIRIYTSRNYLHEKGLQAASGFDKYKLWAADWSSQPYALPWRKWDTWQYTNKGEVEWAESPIDLDRRTLTYC